MFCAMGVSGRFCGVSAEGWTEEDGVGTDGDEDDDDDEDEDEAAAGPPTRASVEERTSGGRTFPNSCSKTWWR